MMSGPTLGNNQPEDPQQLFDVLQEDIAGFGAEERFKNLTLSELNEIGLELQSLSLVVRSGTIGKDEIIATLENIAVKGIHALNQVSDADFQKNGSTLKSTRGAFIRHIRKIAKRFGLQVELGNRIDLWEKSHPRTENTEEQNLQEQREAAFKEVDAQFSNLYKMVTPKFGFESHIILDIMLEDFMKATTPAMAAFFGVTTQDELEKRAETMKAKLKPMLDEALKQDARKAIKTVFEKLAQEKFPTDESVKSLVAANVADSMISHEITQRCRLEGREFADYQPLIYYWTSNPHEYRDVVELRKALIYLANEKWGTKLRSDKRAEPDLEKAKNKVGQNPEMFFGGFGFVAAVPEVPATRREGQPKMPIKNIDELRAELAAQTASAASAEPAPQAPVKKASRKGSRTSPLPSEKSESAIGIPVVSRGPANPHSQPSVMIEGMEDPSKRRTLREGKLAQAAQTAAMGTAPTVLQQAVAAPDAPQETDSRKVKTERPPRPDIQLVRHDSEITKTQTTARKKAERRTSWFNRGVLAVAAALGITAAYGGYQAIKSNADQKTASSNTANSPKTAGPNVAASTTVAPPASVKVAQNPTAVSTASPAPTVALNNQNGATPNVAPNVPAAPPEVAAVLGTFSYGMGTSKGAKAFTGKADMVEGGVDATPFAASVKPASWNQSQQKSAELLMNVYDTAKSRLDKDTVNFITTHEKMIRDLAAQTDFAPWNFKKKFENLYTSGDLFGGTGLYNLLLSLQRVTDLYGGDAEKLFKDTAGIKLTVGGKLNAPEQRFAKAVLYKTAAAPAVPNGNPAPVPTNGVPTNNGGQPQNNPQPAPSKTGFNNFTPGFNGGFTAPGTIPSDVVPANFPAMPKDALAFTYGFVSPQESSFRSPAKTPAQKLRIATDAAPVAPLQSDNLETAFNAFNNSGVVKAADKKEANDYRLAKEVQQHVANEDQKLFDFEQKRRSRGFFTKLADAASYMWSGTTPEERSQGVQGMGGIRSLFMTSAQRQAEFTKRMEAMEAIERKASLAKLMEAQALRAKQYAKAAPAVQPVVAVEIPVAQPTKKEMLRAELDGKMEKLFAKAKVRVAERGPAPLINIRKNYTVTKADKSIKFVLERQIRLSDLSDETKEAALAEVHAMIQTNGDFIESYKMHPDGSRDLVLKDKYIARLNKAAGINIVPQNGEAELSMAA